MKLTGLGTYTCFLYEVMDNNLDELLAQNSLFQAIANHANAVIGAKDLEGRYIYVNKEYSRLFHMDEVDFIGQTDHEIFPEDIATAFRDADIEVAKKKEIVHVEEKVPIDGKIRQYLSVKFPIKNKEGIIFATGLIATDITERYRLENELQESEIRFRTLFNSSPDPAWIIDNYKFLQCNKAAVDTLGYPDKATLINTHPSALSPEFQPDGEPSISKAERMVKIALEKGINRFEWVHTKFDKTVFWAEVTLSPFTQHNKLLIYCVWRDITDKKLTDEKLQFQATHDPLTGLYNRNAFEQRLNEDILRATRYHHDLSIFMIDIDHFKVVNDDHGHRAGDDVLQNFAKLLDSSIRITDYSGRYGGEEFVIVLPETAVEEAKELAEKLRIKIEKHVIAINRHTDINITASIGVSNYPTHCSSAEEMLKLADSALYSAKHAGRNRVMVAEADSE